MKKNYLSPEFELTILSFESILNGKFFVSKNESGSNDHNDDNNDDWG